MCQDGSDTTTRRYYEQFDSKIAVDPPGYTDGNGFIIRGGYAGGFPIFCRAASRNGSGNHTYRSPYLGFRVVRDLLPPQTVVKQDTPAKLPSTTPESQAAAVAAIEKLGGKVTFDEKSPGRPVVKVTLYKTKVTDADLVCLTGLTRLRVLDLVGTQVTDAGLRYLKEMTKLGCLFLSSTQVTDAGLVHFKGLTNLHTLTLSSTQVADAGLVHLERLTNLRSISLTRSQVGDLGLVHFKGLKNLQQLHLGFTKVTDAGLVNLKALTSLTSLGLAKTQVTDEGVKDLQAALPKCRIVK